MRNLGGFSAPNGRPYSSRPPEISREGSRLPPLSEGSGRPTVAPTAAAQAAVHTAAPKILRVVVDPATAATTPFSRFAAPFAIIGMAVAVAAAPFVGWRGSAYAAGPKQKTPLFYFQEINKP